MSGAAEGQQPAKHRSSAHQVEWVRERLSARDWAILTDLDHLRVLSADQLERLHFASLHGRSREVVRGRVLRRLVAWRVVSPLGRRIGGTKRGSSRTVYTLDVTGQRLMRERRAATVPTSRVRRARPPGERFLAHTVAVSELYTVLVSHAARAGITVAAFDAEPAAWWPDGRGWLKPDAYLRLAASQFDDHWWVEVDRATESLSTIQRKLNAYLDFYQRGQLGPNGVMPRVLISTVTERRRDALRDLVEHLPEPADALFTVALDRDSWLTLLGSLKE